MVMAREKYDIYEFDLLLPHMNSLKWNNEIVLVIKMPQGKGYSTFSLLETKVLTCKTLGLTVKNDYKRYS